MADSAQVRPSRAIRQPPGPQTTTETPQGPPWSVSLGCVGGYGPHQHGLQASKKGTGKDTWCHRGRVWLTVRVRPGRGRREKGREWSKRRTGRLRARRAPPSLILAAQHDAAFRHSAAASGSHNHLRHPLAAADNLQTQPSPLSTTPHPRVAPCRPFPPSLARLLPLQRLAPLVSKNGCRRTAGAATSDSGAAAGG